MAEQKKEFAQIANVTNSYLPMIERELEGNSIKFNEYSRRCVVNAISAINMVLDAAGLTFADKSLDQSNITSILLNVASLELNPSANPSECFFQLRNVKKKVNGQDVWQKKIEMNIQGDGYDALLARFGRNVKKVYPYWEVREDDYFEYPMFNGLQMEAPKWRPGGTGKVVRVVYPILHNDNTIHFYISEREDVKKNLIAHINNSMMNETFGICEDRYKATPAQKDKIANKKKELLQKANELGLASLDDEELKPFISPAWQETFSREAMIVRKMRNNITKKIPKDFGSSFAMERFEEATNEDYANIKARIIEGTASEAIEEIAPPQEADIATDEILDGEQGNPQPESENANLGDLERSKPDFD